MGIGSVADLIPECSGKLCKIYKTSSSGEIHISSVNTATHTKILIEDNGAGFDPSKKDKLFHVFERLHTQDEYEGTGVGLAIVKRIMRHHKGAVSISGIPDQGAVVTLYFPVQ